MKSSGATPRRYWPRTPLALAFAVIAAASGAAAHPLDPLSGAEIGRAVAALRRAGDADPATRFALVALDEPEKDAVLRWRPGQPERRKAFVVARKDGTVYEGVVDLAAGAVERWQPVPGAQSALSPEEWDRAKNLTMADAGWRQAMARRGYASVAGIVCTPGSAGFVEPGEAGRRLARVVCFDGSVARNFRAHPVERVVATVDLDAGAVVGLLDEGPLPPAREAGEFGQRPLPSPAASPRSAVRDRFAGARHQVRWRGWSFHYRLDPRAGLVLSLLRREDRGRSRLILYRGSLAEMFVPYMDPDPAWRFRAWLDVAEYGFGWLASPLARGIDCPAGAAMRDAVLANQRGMPVTAPAVICLFERDAAMPLWRHAESATHSYAGRAGRELVMRTIPSIGTYDYIIDWVLTETGGIRIEVGATGIDAAKGVAARTMQDPSAPGDTAHGALVAPNLAAVYHDHFLSFRLDLDIDGERNTLVRETLAPESAGGRTIWRVDDAPVTAEGPPAPAAGHDAAATLWRVENPNVTNRLGRHPGYELRLGHTTTLSAPPDDPAVRRAAFATAPVWLTAYDRRELYAAGDYPDAGAGLPRYAARRRPVENADIVLWCTMGFHHLTRPEDWPVLPTMRHGIELVPDAFFDRNPAVVR